MPNISSEFPQVLPGVYVLSEDEAALTLVGKCDAFLGPEWWTVWCRLVVRLRKVETRCRIGRLPDWRLRGLYTGSLSSITLTEIDAQLGPEPPLYAPWDRHAASTYRGGSGASSFLPWLWNYREQFQCRKKRLRKRRSCNPRYSPTQYAFDPNLSRMSGVEFANFAPASHATLWVGVRESKRVATKARLRSMCFRDVCVLQVNLYRAAGESHSMEWRRTGGSPFTVDRYANLSIRWAPPSMGRVYGVIQNQLLPFLRGEAPSEITDMVYALDYDITDVHQWLVMCDWLEEKLDARVRAALERSLRGVRDACRLIAQLSNEY